MQGLSPIGWALRPLKNYAKFSGRASRAEFWWFVLFMTLFFTACWILVVATVGASLMSGGQPTMAMMGGMGVLGMIVGLLYLGILIPYIAVQVRRLHDTNRSGWWVGGFWLLYLIYLVTAFGMGFSTTPGSPPQSLGGLGAIMIVALLFFVYSIVLLVFFCLRGSQGPNRFGDDPYGADVGEVFA